MARQRQTVKTFQSRGSGPPSRQARGEKQSKKDPKVSESGDLETGWFNAGQNDEDQRGTDFKGKMTNSILDIEVSRSSYLEGDEI